MLKLHGMPSYTGKSRSDDIHGWMKAVHDINVALKLVNIDVSIIVTHVCTHRKYFKTRIDHMSSDL